MSIAQRILSMLNESSSSLEDKDLPPIPKEQAGWADTRRKVGYYVMVTNVPFKHYPSREIVEGPFKTKSYAIDYGKKYYPGKLEVDFGYEDTRESNSGTLIQQGE